MVFYICRSLGSLKDRVTHQVGSIVVRVKNGPGYSRLMMSDDSNDSELGLELGIGGLSGLGPNVYMDAEDDHDFNRL